MSWQKLHGGGEEDVGGDGDVPLAESKGDPSDSEAIVNPLPPSVGNETKPQEEENPLIDGPAIPDESVNRY